MLKKKAYMVRNWAYLRAVGYEDRDDGSCKTRIHTVISAYRSYKDECAKTGNATPKKKPAFFSPCLPKQKHNISPIYHFVYVLNVVAV